MDALSELLRAVKLSGAMFYVAEGSKPWRVLAPPSSKLGKYVSPECEPRDRVSLGHAGRGLRARRRGDDAVLRRRSLMIPHGDAHEMGNGSGAPLIDGEPGMPALLTAASNARASAEAARRRGSSAAISRARRG